MSNTNDLVLHLKLDTIIPDADNQRVRSAFLSENVSAFTESQYTIHGNPQVVPDEHFGSCLIFDGRQDYIEIPNSDAINFATNQDFTVASWIKIAKEQAFKTNGDNDIIEKWNGSGGYPYVIRYVRDNQTIHAARYDGSNNPSVTTTTKLNSEQFYHIAFVKEGSKLQLYLDGHEENSTDDTTQSQTQNDSPLYLARRGGSNEAYANYFAGTIAHLRIYNKALFPEEIKRDMNNDLTAITAFNLAYPLNFNLYEGEDQESVIFIENDTKGEELVFEIQNDTEQGITLPAKSGAVSQNNYHFELRFRPDTLSPKSLQQLALKPQSNWSMSSPVTQADGIVSLYFLTTNTTLSANEVVTLTLPNVSASAAGGARTTRVEFLCPEFTYQGETLTNYYREKTLSIVNHRGKKNIPLHVSFVGSNRILNDGKNQTLILQINNVLKEETIGFNPTSSDNPSRFILYFDVDTDWVLGTKSQVENITVDVEDWQPGGDKEKDWSIYKETQAQPTVPIEGLSAPYWVLTHQNETEPRLAAGHTIQITLTIPACSNVLGQTNLYLRYENIPGYWDGTFVCTIEKSPIIYDNQGNVGIGITPGTEQLKVKGDTAITGKFSLGQLIANYDSGWFDVETNKNYKKEHNLGTFLLVTQILFKDTNGRIWDAKTTLRRVNDGDFPNSYCGYYLLMPDDNTFDFATAGQAVFAADNTSTYGLERKSQRFTKGSYRIFAWRIGATLNE
ncbi:MAG: LamG domain-containing protein [Microcystis viridis Mv_BB_P_19951000_S69]|uniref:LamG domain-containing protein n=1 Tax=Microcystis viridis Mv_BB_P_19951000_S68D TaxID=2486270 RepID=A0A552IA89_MICVR|nr:MAG: LamG domain-containing protein [Microcystis viridis Mv_BB_P_19951000_S69]TRU73490.1 MAG: LamG domain-containing protein [Microcystis viridis Mv_BB_P_19951000_S68]TRU80368.1 MAG: LamG domain-containing protein [Microcystis viridis Mv_BB_P_19951000_S68D]TRU80842.1 MAG: LamG domain-containing protein [Microcystis viridis Mv_BB_P_19951000_S69D]